MVKKKAYLQRMQAQLKGWVAKIDTLSQSGKE
jgi:hypothetical protein